MIAAFFRKYHLGAKACLLGLTLPVVLLFAAVASAALVNNGNGTITDTNTGLLWQQQDDGIPRNWQEALHYSENLSLGGCTTWRLPNIKELRSIIDLSQTNPAIDVTVFLNTKSDKYWSSSPLPWFKKIFVVDFTNGKTTLSAPLSTVHYIRAVSAGCALDGSAPQVTSTAPANNATGVAINSLIRVNFNEEIAPATITPSTFVVRAAGVTPITGSVSYNSGSAVFTPTGGLTTATVYTATVTTAVQDLAGNGLAADYKWTFSTVDTTPPSGSITINGNAVWTKSALVNLALPASDDSGTVSSMQLSNDGVSWNSWETYNPIKQWSLTAGDGDKTVYVRYRDSGGNLSPVYNDTIKLDTAAPSLIIDPVVSPTTITSQTVSGTAEAGATVEVRVNTWATTCVVAVTGATWSCTINGLAAGENVVTATATDAAGNTSSATARIVVDTTAPTGSITINGGNEWTNSNQVTLNLSAIDTGGAAISMRVGEAGSSWNAWELLTPTKSWTLSPLDETKTIYAQFKDAAGNISGVYSDTIKLDTASPLVTIDSVQKQTRISNQTITGTREDSATIAITVSTPSTVGAVTYPTAITWACSLSNLAPGLNTVSVTATDAAGNAAKVTTDITLDTVAPTGSLSINNGANETGATGVILTLSSPSADESGVSVQISNNGTTWSAWESYAATKAWTLTAGDGLKTVYAKLKDAAGNESSPFSDTIILDTIVPFVTVAAVTSPTKTATQSIHGTKESGSTVMISVSAAGALVGSIAYPTATSWQCNVSLVEGTNNIIVTAVDGAGNVSDSATASIVLDTIAQVTIDPVTSPTNIASHNIAGTREANATVEVKMNGTQACLITSPGSTWTCSLTNMAAGANMIVVTATDTPLGNKGTAAASIQYDNTVPAGTVIINQGATITGSLAVTLNLSATDNSGAVSSARFSNDGTNWGAWGAYASAKTWNLTSGDGLKTVYAQFMDAAGNASSTVSDTITLDTTAPSVVINPVTSPTKVTTQTISGAREADNTISVAAPGGLANQVSYPTATTWQCPINLQEGTNAITVTARDGAGNTASAATSILLDTVAQVTIDTVVSPTGSTTQTISGAREAGAPVQVTVNTTASVGAVEYPGAQTWRCTLNGLVTGGNTITATATDSLGNTGTASATINVDHTSPSGTVVINGGAGVSNSAAVVLSLSATDNSGQVAFMRFSNNGTDWGGWLAYATTSTWSLLPGDGIKTVSAQFKDTAGNISAASSDTITLDTVAPLVTINPVTSPTKVTTQTISGANEDGATISVTAPGGLATPVSNPTTTTWQCVVNLLEGANAVSVTGLDSANNTANVTVSILRDTVGQVTIDEIFSPTNVVAKTISGTLEQGAALEVRVNGGSPNLVTMTGSTTWQSLVSLVEGSNVVTANVTDVLGNTGSATRTVILDTVAPAVSINPPTSPTKVASQVLTGTMEIGAQVVVSATGASLSSLTYPSATTWQATLSLAEGVNNILVTAKDAAGNSSSATASVILDSKAYVTVTPVTSPTNVSSQTISGDREGNATVTVSANSPVIVGVISYPSPSTWQCSISNLAEGPNTLTVTATDALGNTNSVSATIALDTVSPTVTIAPVSSPVNAATQTISGTRSSDALISVNAAGSRIIGFSYPTPTSWSCTLTLAEGNNLITVTAKDGAGNSSSAQTSILIDTIAQISMNPINDSVNTATLTISGTREINAVVTVTALGGQPGPVGYPTATTWQCDVSLSDGANTITAMAVDALGNSMSVSDTVDLDTVAPAVSINPVPTLTNEPTQTITGTRDSDGVISVAAPGAAVQSISYTSSSTWKCILRLAEGLNTITVTANDPAGNRSNALAKITLDTVATVTINRISSPTNVASQTLGGKREIGAAISVTGVTAGAVDLSVADAWKCPITLAEGSNSITVTANDGLNITSASTTVVLDTTPPAAVSFTATDLLLGGTVALGWTAYDSVSQGVAAFMVYVSPTPFSNVTNMYPLRKLGPGTKDFMAYGLIDNQRSYFAVVAYDSAGNFNPLVSSVAVTPTTQGIHGYVTSASTGAPLQGAEIQIAGYETVTTNAEGYYLRAGLPIGSYALTVSGPGYMDGYASAVQVTQGQVTKNDFTLTPEVLKPSVPLDVTAVAGDGEVTISWTPVADMDLAGYNLYRFKSPTDVNPVLVNPELIGDKLYVDMDLSNGVTYYYTVRSVNLMGVASADSAMVSATPQAGPPQPPLNLAASLAGGNRVTLTWEKSPTVGVTGYNIYWDNGSGTINFGTVLASVGGSATTWTSNALVQGATYKFGLQAVKVGITDGNTSLMVSVTIPDGSYNGPRAVIVAPVTGKTISGNLITVEADLSRGNVTDVKDLTFQYRPAGSADWIDIPAATAYSLNPDDDVPYFVHWDVKQLPEGPYELRAMAADRLGGFDSSPDTVTITISHRNPFIDESWNDKNHHRFKKKVWRGVQNNLKFYAEHLGGSFSVSIPADTLETNAALIAEAPKTAEMAGKVAAGYSNAGSFLRLRIGSGQKQFATGKEIAIALPYADNNSDGIVDGTRIPVATLTIYWYNPENGKWELSGITGVVTDTVNKKITGRTSHFSDFALLAPPVDTDNDGILDSSDNCPLVANPTQDDTDGDGVGNACDICLNDPYNDADLDGVCGNLDACPNDPNKGASSGVCGCGIPDTDSDGDGMADCIDPFPHVPSNDTDGDGILDSLDNCPTVANSTQADIDSDGLGNACDACPLDPANDADGDGVCGNVDGCPNDRNKVAPGICGCGVADVDTDGDGARDCMDNCPNDPNKTFIGACGCGVPDTDSDGDGAANCVDAYPQDPKKFKSEYQVPVHDGWWQLFSILAGLYFFRRRKGTEN